MIGPDTYGRLYDIAEAQAGYFTTAQAELAGVDRSQLSRQVSAGRLRRVSRGLYRLVFYPDSLHEDLVIAWLQTGPGSAISHGSALALYGLSDSMPAETNVTIPRTASRRRPGLRLHTSCLSAREVTHRYGLDVTTVPRTIADVAAAGLSEEFVTQAVEQAVQRGLAMPEDLLAAVKSERVRRLFLRALAAAEADR